MLSLSVKVVRRAQWIERIEIVACALLAIFVAMGVAYAFSWDRALLGTLILLLLIWSMRVRYRLRRVEWGALERDSNTFLDGEIRRYRARLRRAWIDLALFAPAAVLGLLYAAQLQGGADAMVDYLLSWSTVIKLTIVAVVVGVLLYRLRRHRAAVRGLSDALADFRRETDLDRVSREHRQN